MVLLAPSSILLSEGSVPVAYKSVIIKLLLKKIKLRPTCSCQLLSCIYSPFIETNPFIKNIWESSLINWLSNNLITISLIIFNPDSAPVILLKLPSLELSMTCISRQTLDQHPWFKCGFWHRRSQCAFTPVRTLRWSSQAGTLMVLFIKKEPNVLVSIIISPDTLQSSLVCHRVLCLAPCCSAFTCSPWTRLFQGIV